MSTSTPDPTGTVVLCGSVTRAVDALAAAVRHYRAQGYRVQKPVKDDSLTPQEHAERWYALIDAADLVVLCRNLGDRWGEQTLREEQHAIGIGKTPAIYLHREERAS